MVRYNYQNPDRFFAEPLQRVIMILMWSGFLSFSPFIVDTLIKGDRGASYNNTILGVILSGIMIYTFFILISYTVLYYGRGWNNKQKWNMKDAIIEDAKKWHEEHPNETPSIKPMILMFIIILGFMGFGIYIWWSLDDAIDPNILHNQIMTNQTYVDNLSCDKISLTKNTLSMTWSLRQQNEIEQLKVDFDRLYKEKNCN